MATDSTNQDLVNTPTGADGEVVRKLKLEEFLRKARVKCVGWNVSAEEEKGVNLF